MLNPPIQTPYAVVRLLEAGNTVPLDGPGWSDTQKGPCPDCGKLVMSIKWAPHVRFTYGMTLTHPHRCGEEPVPDQDHPRWLQLEAVNRELDQLAQQRIAEEQRQWLP
jgi:hypothetical protein